MTLENFHFNSVILSGLSDIKIKVKSWRVAGLVVISYLSLFLELHLITLIVLYAA